MGPVYIYFVSVAWTLLIGSFLFGSRRVRGALLIVGVFTFGIQWRILVQIDPPKIFALLGILFYCAQVVRTDRFLTRQVFPRFIPFILWTVIMCLVGYSMLEPVKAATWSTSSSARPFIQLFSISIFLSYIPILNEALKTPRDVVWFLTQWARIALAAAALCYFQAAWHIATGSVLWGVTLVSKEQIAVVNLAGLTIQRVNGFGGEPKMIGMAFAMTLAMLISTWSRGILRFSPQRHLLYICFIGGALIITFSSGAYLIIALFLLTQLTRLNDAKTRRFASIFLFAAIPILVLGSTHVFDLVEHRMGRILNLAKDVSGQDTSLTSAEKYDFADKEKPAMIYLVQNPLTWVTGVGVGASPYYYEHLVKVQYKRGLYQEPNGGVTWAIYSFGLIGIGLFLFAMWRFIPPWRTRDPILGLKRDLYVGIAITFIPLHPISWLMIVLGFGWSQGVRMFSSNKATSGNRRPPRRVPPSASN